MLDYETATLLGFIGLGLGALAILGFAALTVQWARLRRRAPGPSKAPAHTGDWRDGVPPEHTPLEWDWPPRPRPYDQEERV